MVLTENGGPQGSVLILMGWIILIYDIFTVFNEEVRGLFVDDVSLVVSERDTYLLVVRLPGFVKNIKEVEEFY